MTSSFVILCIPQYHTPPYFQRFEMRKKSTKLLLSNACKWGKWEYIYYCYDVRFPRIRRLVSSITSYSIINPSIVTRVALQWSDTQYKSSSYSPAPHFSRCCNFICGIQWNVLSHVCKIPFQRIGAQVYAHIVMQCWQCATALVWSCGVTTNTLTLADAAADAADAVAIAAGDCACARINSRRLTCALPPKECVRAPMRTL